MHLTGALRIYIRTRDGRLRHGLSFPCWLPMAAVMAAVALLGHLLWRLPELTELQTLHQRADASRAERAAQRTGLLGIHARLGELRQELEPMTTLNAKLTALTSLSDTGRQEPSMGSPSVVESGLHDEKRLTRQMSAMVRAMVEEIAFQETRQKQLVSILRERALEFAARPSLWPARGPINSEFGERFMGRSREFHKGIDIGMPLGSQIVAPADGKVLSVGYESGYGLLVVLEHRHGVTTAFAHLRSAEVEVGDSVSKGVPIARSGMSGRSTGSHLHYEVRVNNQPVDPMNYMLN